MVEGSETSGRGRAPDPAGGSGAEGRRRGEGDLLAERRARRAAESGEQSLARRAEAAEATVRTLEAHVASLQQRLRDELQDEAAAPSGLPAQAPGSAAAAGGERAQGGEGKAEGELRRARQREYAEQRQRVEAEERLVGLERDAATEVERLRRRLSESEAEAGMLAGRLEQLRRELAEAEQALAAERVALRRAETHLQARVEELQRAAAASERELASERTARERAELALARMREGQGRLEVMVAELKATSQRLRAAAEAVQPARPPAPAQAPSAPAAPTTAPPTARAAGAEPRPRDEVKAQPTPRQTADAPLPVEPRRPGEVLAATPAAPPQPEAGERVRAATAHSGEMVQALAAAVERLRARASEQTPPAVVWPVLQEPRHKHSMSLIGRWRAARKERRGR